MWLIALLSSSAWAADPEPTKPESTAVGLGGHVAIGGSVSALARVRLPSAVSWDLSVGTGLRYQSPVTQTFGSLEFESARSSRSGVLTTRLRLPLVQSDRQDVLGVVGLQGSLGRSIAEQLDFGTLPGPGTVEQRRNQRRGSIFAGVDVDHWITPGCAVTIGARLLSIDAGRTSITVGDDEPQVSTSTSLGVASGAHLGLTGYF